jgi:hypothetical protein
MSMRRRSRASRRMAMNCEEKSRRCFGALCERGIEKGAAGRMKCERE